MKKRTKITLACVTLLLIVMLFVFLVSYASANFDLYKSEPNISVTSPVMNGIYEQSTIRLNVKIELDSHFFIAHEMILWINYSLDGQPGVNLTFKSEVNSRGYGYVISAAKTFADLSEGVHSLSVYGQTILSDYSNGKPLSNFSVTNYFIIGNVTPAIHVVSPQPKTYDSTSMLLEFKTDKPLSWVGFSLDNNQAITSLATLSLNSLLDGPHTLRMYGNDTQGNLYTSQVIGFTVRDHNAPIINIDATAIAARTTIFQPAVFNFTNIPLIIEINEPTPWVGYSMDGKVNKTIFGNSTIISHVPFGAHKIIVYAKDNGGNVGTSEVYSFNLSQQGISDAKLTPVESPGNPLLSTLLIGGIATTGLVLIAVGVYCKKHKQKLQELQT